MAAAFPSNVAGTFGALSLDNTTFDKVRQIPGFSLFAKIAAVNYDSSEDEFGKLCKQGQYAKSILFGNVDVEEIGDEQNSDLAERYSVQTSDYPAYLLFQPGQESPLRFEPFPDPAAREPHDWDADEDGDWEAPEISEKTADNLATWLRMQGVRMPTDGQILELDDAAEAFMKGGYKDSDLDEAKKVAEAYSQDPKAAIYIKTMEKVKAKGAGYIESEMSRLRKIMDGKITSVKRNEMQTKVGILQVFAKVAASS